MVQYEKIEDAMLSIVKYHGTQILLHPKKLIALLSDYAPELSIEQRMVRKFIRAGGNNILYHAITKKSTWIDIFPKICHFICSANIPFDLIEWTSSSLMAFILSANPDYDNNTSPETIHQEGMKYFRQFPREQNIPVAVLLLCEAGKKGNPESYFFVANCYLKGKGIPINIEKGLSYLKQAVDGGSESATLELAERYFTGKDVEMNHKNAVSLLTKLKTSSQAQFMLGEIYSKNQMNQEAFLAYLESAESGNVHGQYAVALCYAIGKGVKRDINSAKKWLKSAAKLGHTEARQKLIDIGENWE